ncbi:MBL fold metallo-hydrolase [Mycolicibacterium komossense]|uniref:MBL fold metallo-hydrolase n=1 Tax=Mycolicibacterium komossense TaxID=1779 RepID=A0ABT3CBZ0_9MYCO|nr:MBL fold metallo-hydrolase [Mycolicibacterium komossense]MCV7227002.1 MBL fold metallo-hydrolase [Mycolicibacterium komossense]
MLITGFATGASEANCYLLAPRSGAEAIVIDPGVDVVATLDYYFDVNELTPAAVLLTHGHPSHTASVTELCDGWEVPAYLHAADRSLLADQHGGLPEQIIDIADAAELRIADILVTVDHTPGHTAGSVVFRVTAESDEGDVGVAFTGDTLLCRTIGRGDNPGEDLRQVLASIRAKLMVLDDKTVVLPGHGISTTIGAERRFNPYLKRMT